MAQAANVTKYAAGGTGDNIIADGYIKTVAKMWLDTYTMAAATTIPSATTIDIAFIPNNKKIVGVDLYFPSLSTGASGTGSTITIGTRTSAGVTSATTLLSAGEAVSGILTLSANSNIPHAIADGYNYVCMTFGRIATTTTASTIRSVVRYT
jgi:hypothetical protein